jgi:hypothetical protein
MPRAKQNIAYKPSAFDKAEMRYLGLDPSHPEDVRFWLRERKKLLARAYEETTDVRGAPRKSATLRPHNPGRPSRSFMKACTPKVARTRARDPKAVCASQYRKLSLSQKRAWENPIRVGSRVTLVHVRNWKTGRPVTGVFTVVKQFSDGEIQVRNSGGTTYRIPPTHVRMAKNALTPGGNVKLHAVTYKERKKGDGRPELYEHVFGEEGGKKPRLAFDGRDLDIKRAGSRYTVKDGWIHD